MEDYKLVIGKLRGLEEAELIAKGLYKDMVERVEISEIRSKLYGNS